jgi:hypothetical protein
VLSSFAPLRPQDKVRNHLTGYRLADLLTWVTQTLIDGEFSSILASIEGTCSAGSMERQGHLSIQSLVQRIKRPPSGHEKRLAKFFHVEILNHRLGGGRDHEISKRFAASGVDFWTFAGFTSMTE